MSDVVIDLFAGPGGWDVAAAEFGIHPLGIEHDAAACATREAAGLRTLQADVASLDPLNFAPCVGLIASPPCQAFSMAGKGEGRGAMDAYRHVIGRMAKLWDVDYDALDRASGDPRGHLVIEPLRWALMLRPRWIALEQVPPVLPLWEAMANALRGHGYSVATGILSAEQYGVPQTRKRAILMASLDGEARLPQPTHQRYVPPRSRDDEGGGMFDLPDAERIVHREDRELLPWVSMAQALGWAPDALCGFPRRNDTPSNGAAIGDTGEYRERDLRPASEPAFVVTEKARSWTLRAGTNDHDASRDVDEPAPTLRFGARLNTVEWVSNAQENAARRTADEPAPTITGGHDHNERRWVTHYDRRQGHTAPDGERTMVRQIPVDEPAPTIGSQGLARGRDVWVSERPSTTVNGDPRIAQPGHKGDMKTEPDAIRQMEGAVRVTLQEALILQSFPPDYPVQGTKTKQFEQVGNAVPPLLAWHVLRAAAATGMREAA